MKQINLLMLAVLTTVPVFAQSQALQLPTPPSLPNNDPNAKLTKEQLRVLMPPLAEHFDQIDTAHQGYVTPAQIQQYLGKQMPQQPPSQFPPKIPS
ncbi:EF-hand domain-containing protein [Caballeronia sp. S22]|uniref:EF-hand domain-containing protein n=1 Tax=Caballeronia sp. S22 TaxID=3137182 RepID=UPI0035307AD2